MQPSYYKIFACVNGYRGTVVDADCIWSCEKLIADHLSIGVVTFRPLRECPQVEPFELLGLVNRLGVDAGQANKRGAKSLRANRLLRYGLRLARQRSPAFRGAFCLIVGFVLER